MAIPSTLASRARTAGSRQSFRQRLADGYAEFYADNRATHELTISFGLHPRKFDPETEFLPQMRRIVRRVTHEVLGIPRRKLVQLAQGDALWMAGFFEATDGAGELFPHWHGVVALEPGEEWMLRQSLSHCVGPDMTPAFSQTNSKHARRSVISIQRAKPTFHLTELTTASTYISYATKTIHNQNVIHWTTGDFLHNGKT
jgi:hypothetical protein